MPTPRYFRNTKQAAGCGLCPRRTHVQDRGIPFSIPLIHPCQRHSFQHQKSRLRPTGNGTAACRYYQDIIFNRFFHKVDMAVVVLDLYVVTAHGLPLSLCAPPLRAMALIRGSGLPPGRIRFGTEACMHSCFSSGMLTLSGFLLGKFWTSCFDDFLCTSHQLL